MTQFQPEGLLENLPLKYYVIELNEKKILKTNDQDIEPEINTCYRLLFNKNKPCHEKGGKCICQQQVERGKTNSYIVEKEDRTNKYFKANFTILKNNLVAVSYLDVTGEFNYKKEIKINSKRLERAEKLVDFGYWEFNIDDKIMLSSKGARKIYGVTGEKIPLKDIQEIALQKYREKLDNSLAELIGRGKPYNVIFEIKRPLDGEIRIIHSIAEYRADKRMVFGTIRDITQNRKTEEELNKSNELLRTVIDLIPDSIYMKDRESRKLVANKGDAKHCGVSDVNEIIGKTDYDLYPKEIADLYAADDKKVIKHGERIINREEVLPDKDKNRWVLTSKIPLKNQSNEIVGLVGIGRDITEFKEQESKLRLLQQTIEQNPLSIVITNADGIIEYVNPAYTKITGYQFSEAIGKSPGIVKSGSHKKSFYKKIWDTINSGNTWSGEIYNKRKDGTLYWQNSVVAPILDNKNEIKHFVSINEDITEKKQIIKELEIARDKAEESDRLKSLFLANMSHEIRTPLNGILGFSNVICSGVVEEKDKLEYYGTIIENCGKRLVTVIDDIIDISMIQSNQLKIEYNHFDVNELLNEIFVLYQSQKADRLSQIDFKVVLSSEPADKNLYSDKHRIFQVLKNLLDNAFKFTESGFIEFGCDDSTREELTLFVKDSGIGIKKEKRKLIFESFRQAEEGNSRKYDGSGLGLAITSGIMERLHGKVWVKSELGKGSVFYAAIPRSEKDDHLDFSGKSKTANKAANDEKHSKKRILSFEDDNASIEYLKSVASSMGYELVNFTCARDGIQFLKNNHVNIVLMDVQLPEMDGYEATRMIKSEFPNLPVIIQTAYAMKGDREKALNSGCNEYLAKPVNLNELKEKIKQYIE